MLLRQGWQLIEAATDRDEMNVVDDCCHDKERVIVQTTGALFTTLG